MPQQVKPIQKILFGSPGTGKSHKIRAIATSELGIPFDNNTQMLSNTVKTVFHPEYTYADFMGKLLPLTQNNSVIYKFYSGHFLRVLGMAYQSLIEDNKKNYLIPSSKEITDMDKIDIESIIREKEEREREGEEEYQKQLRMAVF